MSAGQASFAVPWPRARLASATSLEVACAALPAVDSHVRVRAALGMDPIAGRWAAARRVHLIAVGKASEPMARAIANVAGDRLAGGIVIGPAARPADAAGGTGADAAVGDGLTAMAGDHPVPGKRSRAAARMLRAYLSAAAPTTGDLVVFAVSGGGSAMLAEPAAPLTLEDLHELTVAMLRCGIDVTRMNDLRRAVSLVHGGRLVALCQPAPVLGLILCDNIQVGLPGVASGLTYPGSTDLTAAAGVLSGISQHLPRSLLSRVLAALDRAAQIDGVRSEGDVLNIGIAGPQTALSAAVAAARQRGLRVVNLGARVGGEARDVARRFVAVTQHALARDPSPVCVLGAGEVTVTVRGSGQGGRCQELAWCAMHQMDQLQLPGASFTALATDGQDFRPGVMGASVDSAIAKRVTALGLSWDAVLAQNDSGTALDLLGATLPARETRTNVCDIYVLTAGGGAGTPETDRSQLSALPAVGSSRQAPTGSPVSQPAPSGSAQPRPSLRWMTDRPPPRRRTPRSAG